MEEKKEITITNLSQQENEEKRRDVEQSPRPAPPDSAEKYFMETISSTMERKLNKKLRKLADHINDYI